MSASSASASSYSERCSAQVAQLQREIISQARARAAKAVSVRAANAACVCFAKAQRGRGIEYPVHLPDELRALLLQFVGVEALRFSEGFTPMHEVFSRGVMELRIGWDQKEMKPRPMKQPGSRSLLERASGWLLRLPSQIQAEAAAPAPSEKAFVPDFDKFQCYLPHCYQDGPLVSDHERSRDWGAAWDWNKRTIEAGVLAYRFDATRGALPVRLQDAHQDTLAAIPPAPGGSKRPPTFHPKAIRSLWISFGDQSRDTRHTFCMWDEWSYTPRMEVRRGTPRQCQNFLLAEDGDAMIHWPDHDDAVPAVVWIRIYVWKDPELFPEQCDEGETESAEFSVVLMGDVADAILQDHADEMDADARNEAENGTGLFSFQPDHVFEYCEKKSGPDDLAMVTDCLEERPPRFFTTGRGFDGGARKIRVHQRCNGSGRSRRFVAGQA
mmetsp:Transcript_27339/g.68944  ORF Transcript_27339/g.68944 Transcript_27339/m.68944 type:complete len:440 (-) Transcript_27339:274-1593(-)